MRQKSSYEPCGTPQDLSLNSGWAMRQRKKSPRFVEWADANPGKLERIAETRNALGSGPVRSHDLQRLMQKHGVQACQVWA